MAWHELLTKNYLLFHTTLEGFAIVIAASIFIIATRTYRFSGNMHLYVLGTAYLFVAITDYLHLLTYKGMQIFQGLTANTPTQLWIAGRYLETLSLRLRDRGPDTQGVCPTAHREYQRRRLGGPHRR